MHGSPVSKFFLADRSVYLVQSTSALDKQALEILSWALQATPTEDSNLKGTFVGPRKEMVTPWSTNATDIARNMGLGAIKRVEQFIKAENEEFPSFDPMLEIVYRGLSIQALDVKDEPVEEESITDIRTANAEQGLALSEEEIVFLENAAKTLERPLTDAELYGFAQINSEHCRHKIFNGSFIIDQKEQPKSLFAMIKDTSKAKPEELVSAYKDNVAFIKGPKVNQFAPSTQNNGELAGPFAVSEIESIISLKAETHNFPTTVEPFYGASTGGGGEIRDRMAGGCGSLPLVGTAVYMTAYPRLQGSRTGRWERNLEERPWKYQTPAQILIKASNGASDFGNKFGQPLICGSVQTFEQKTTRGTYGFDRAVMLAGGVGYANSRDAEKKTAAVGDLVVILGGDNYRIGMAGSSVSSVDTGQYSANLELNAVQRANPEMQKRVFNVIRSLTEATSNPIKLIHDHGAGGHMNCLSELLEPLGGVVKISALPIGDPTLSAKEILCNESQERMGLVVAPGDIDLLKNIAARERAPIYVVGEISGDGKLKFLKDDSSPAVDLPYDILFGAAPKTVLTDDSLPLLSPKLEYRIDSGERLLSAIEDVLSLESVACKDWLTNKVDRSVTGRIALQQTTGPLQLPLNNLGVTSLDQQGTAGIATAIGHAPVAGLLDERAGSVLSVAESLTNIVWAPLKKGLDSVVLSANWMWPAKQKGENARLYRAVEALAKFAIELGIPVPTGKDSLSMTMKYQSGAVVKAPGTVIVSAAAECDQIRRCVTPDLKPHQGSRLLWVDLSAQRDFHLGGSAFAQTLGQLGDTPPSVNDPKRFREGFNLIQKLIRKGSILAGHDVSSGGTISAVLEMAFAGDIGIDLTVAGSAEQVVDFLFCEKPAVILQVTPENIKSIGDDFKAIGLETRTVGEVKGTMFKLHAEELSCQKPIADLRRTWFWTSTLLDQKQTAPANAKERFENLGAHHLHYSLPAGFQGSSAALKINPASPAKSGLKAAVIRDQGTNGDREMAYALFLAGFEVFDITMTDLTTGRRNLDEIDFLAFPGGFSNSDVLGSARGWAGTFRYNDRAWGTLKSFMTRENTLSLGVCNGCQLMMALELLCPEHQQHPKMNHNESGRFESIFTAVKVLPTQSILLQPLVGCELGVWAAHGEGRFEFSELEDLYDIPLKYSSTSYPTNPNGSQFNAAALCSQDGRHLVMMPHLERSLHTWNWPHKGSAFKADDEFSPWILPFLEAREWLTAKK
jgi:phosphoribosylformylglycinamidine synthase